MSREHGFSLLEVLVAFVIMALSLGVLYQAVTGSVANMGITERHTHALLLAESLLASHQKLPPSGVRDNGHTADGYHWQLQTHSVVDTRVDQDGIRDDVLLLEATVEWGSPRPRQIVLQTVLPVIRP
ncbi:general secretion pathway protein I [Ectothiorhodospira magna]|uniref:General secretion pathway protein I n=1 Tax=Ectothiorhodospira magna TaxID=867345 RepID=A0A1H9BIK7_9GAMM|nr:prepilin-type N-terminal cleavage/methylation domain-containing protein [Ectothiorhodospira magna]SEP88796.1 general secretion pathway protein I [Ectothiorhodospira magna]